MRGKRGQLLKEASDGEYKCFNVLTQMLIALEMAIIFGTASYAQEDEEFRERSREGFVPNGIYLTLTSVLMIGVECLLLIYYHR